MADWELPLPIQDALAEASFATLGPKYQKQHGVLDRNYYFKDGRKRPWWNRPPWKQPIDQTLHCGIGLVIGWTATHAPWLAIPLAGFVFGREQSQGKSRRKYDPHLDWTFYFLGFYLGRLLA